MADRIRKPLMAGNWKMHNTVGESVALASAVKAGADTRGKADVLVAPSYSALYSVAQVLKGSGVLLAAQDCHWETKGAFTSAVSPVQVKDLGCTHVVIGHSERRKVFGDTDQIINRKIKAALKEGLAPIFCIGETIGERESNSTYRVLETQLNGGLAGLAAGELGSLVVAYEPVWAIGTGKTATPEQAQDAHVFVRRHLERLYGKAFASAVRILYGGSVKADNVDYIMAQPDVDGALVGGESLKADKFLRIAHFEEVLAR